MGLSGTLDTMPVVEFMNWLGRRVRTGTLSFKRGPVTKTVTLDAGRITNAGSTDPREYFGQFLINFGLISEDQLQKAFETQLETKVLLGRILVMTGLVSEDQIHRMLELKIRETVLDLFLWDEGMFEFHDGVVAEQPSTVPVAVELASLLSEGVSRRNLYQEIRRAIPDNNCRFACSANPPVTLDPRSTDGVMLELARQGLSAQDIILRFHSLDYPILRNLHEMVRRGWLAVAEPAADIPEPDVDVEVFEPATRIQSGTDQALLAAEAAIQQRDYSRAVAILRRGLQDFPYDPDLCDALETAEKGLVNTLRSELLSENRIPYLLRPDALAQVSQWTPAQRYLLSRVDGQRNLRSIIMVSPLKEVEALRTFQSLIQAGIVGLR
jgi:hypothetical protein